MSEHRRLIIATLLCLATLPGLAQAAGGDAADYRAAYQLVLDERWIEAEKAFSAFVESHPSSEWADDAAFWRCYARERAGMDPRATFDCYLELRERWPDSEWADDAERGAVGVARRLARDGDDSYLERVRGFDEGDDDTTLTVLAALAEVGDAASVQAILDRLERTEDPGLRAEMVEILEDTGSSAAEDAILRLARSDPSAEVRETAVEVLADRGGPRAFDVLVAVARGDSHRDVRAAAAYALGELEDPRTVAVLEDLAKGGDPEVAEAAVEALAESGQPGTLPILDRLLTEAISSELRRDLVEAMADHHGLHVLPRLQELARGDDPDLAEAAIEGLAEIDHPAAVSTLEEIVRNPGRSGIRVAAVDSLSHSEAPGAFEALRKALETADDPRVRAAAAEGLGDREDDRAIEALAKAARLDADPEVRARATEALGDIGSARARDALIDLLQH